MKKVRLLLAKAFVTAAIIFVTSCNSGETGATTSDTAQPVPGINDSVPGVLNPGQGDTTNATVTPPTTNDNISIMPDSTTVNQ